ncbi:hypothetical protein OHA57_04675 [Streptomyces anulatus]|uniref:hypothetical protein n=1 Tax=Streptomyces anulatus TaxID=1892 RepID=UPI002DDA71F5|nr:hypothetical protein [Streptomyces anulatus]WSC60073.1 hypothetical protein OHA57_04675 [Streptomyces anulatus]
MTTLSYTETQPVALPPAVPTDYIFGVSDPDDACFREGVHAVVTLKVAMTRDMLAVALNLNSGASEEDPDTWDVPYIRESVELALHCDGPFTIQQDGGLLLDAMGDESVRAYIQATYRAIDRAYPHLAPKGNH